MQSFTTTDKTNVTHAKVEFNNEFRRFSLETLSFTYLEQLIRSLFDIDAATSFKIQFLDDEKDWVLISSDEELTYASSLVGQPLRLSIKLSQTTQAKPTRCPRREKFDFSDPAARKEHKISCVSSRIEMLEGKLANDDLPAGKARIFREKVDRLQQKLEHLKSDTPSPVKAEGQEECWGRGKGRGRWGGNGRGRGGCGGRRDWASHPMSPETQLLFTRVQDCKMELRTARQANNEQDIQAKWEALQQAKTECRAAKFGRDAKPGRGCKNHGSPHWEEIKQKKDAKHVCMMNLRKAREAGNQDEIEACRQALSWKIRW
jgi:hypothetical protein